MMTTKLLSKAALILPSLRMLKPARAYGWQVLRVESSEDVDAMQAAIEEAKADTMHPSLIIVRTHIGFGSPKQDSPSCHGEPLGGEALAATKEKAGWPQEMFYVPAEVKEHFAAKLDGCAANEAAWKALMDDYKMVYPELAKELEDRIAGNSMVNLECSGSNLQGYR